MMPCVEVAAVWTVPGAVSPGRILAEPRKGDKLTPRGNENRVDSERISVRAT